MAKTDRNSVLFNAAGIGIVVLTMGYIIKDAFSTKDHSACSERYDNSMAISLSNTNGAPLSPIELQARSGSREWGLLENASVTAGGAENGRPALNVALKETETHHLGLAAGIGFAWQPANLAAARAVCLSYNLYLPEDFDFGRRGVLPGIYGGRNTDVLDEQVPRNGFAALPGWSDNGVLGIEVRRPGVGTYWGITPDVRIPRGQWVKIDQEIELSSPGAANGRIQLWIDGLRRFREEGVALNGATPVHVGGVAMEAGREAAGAPVQKLMLSPVELSWK